jgi:hypothetical protein
MFRRHRLILALVIGSALCAALAGIASRACSPFTNGPRLACGPHVVSAAQGCADRIDPSGSHARGAVDHQAVAADPSGLLARGGRTTVSGRAATHLLSRLASPTPIPGMGARRTAAAGFTQPAAHLDPLRTIILIC